MADTTSPMRPPAPQPPPTSTACEPCHKRISLSALDPNRAEIDRVVTEMLGLPVNAATESMLTEWRRLMCIQPIVNAKNKSVLKELCRAGIAP